MDSYLKKDSDMNLFRLLTQVQLKNYDYEI